MSLRDIVGRHGLVPGGYALHSGMISGATILAAGGVSTMKKSDVGGGGRAIDERQERRGRRFKEF